MKFDVLRDGESDLLGNGGLDDSDPIQDNLVTNDDLRDFVWLKPVEFDVDAMQGMLKEERCDVHVWVGLVPAVKGASSTDSRESCASCRSVLMLRGATVRVEIQLYGVDDIVAGKRLFR